MSSFQSRHVERYWKQIDYYSRMLFEILKEASGCDLWVQEFKDTNPIGNLVLHLSGNLNHRIGVGVAGYSYERNRSTEFSRRKVPKAELEGMLSDALKQTKAILENVPDKELPLPHKILDEFPEKDIGDLIATVTAHFGYHVGQAMTKSARLKRVGRS